MKIKSILFVCMGNICRSPAAEAILKKNLKTTKLDSTIFVDSAGTISYHSGELPDERMIACGLQRGYVLDHRARMFSPQIDFDKFDFIITMDDQNYSTILRLDTEKKFTAKIKKAADFCEKFDVKEVPDPYYEDESVFYYVIDILEDACDGIIKKLRHDQYSD